MPAVKRKAAASSSGAKPKRPTNRQARTNPARRPKLAAQLDMYIRRDDDDEIPDDDDDGAQTPAPKQNGKAAAHDVEYEPESDEASDVADTDDDAEEPAGVKTVSAANLAFLEGLDKNKALDVSQKDAKLKAKQLKRDDRRAFDDERKRIAAENKARLAQPLSEEDDDDDDEFDSDLLSDQEEEQEEDDEVVRGEKRHFQEYSDVSEGEEVGASSDEDEAPTRKAEPKRKLKTDDDAEASYLARLGKRKAREQYMLEEERRKRVNAKLPVRRLDGESASSEEELDQEDDEVEDEDREESEPDGLGSDVPFDSASDEEAPAPKSASRAVHAPIPRGGESSDDEPLPSASAPAAPHTSITHSARFNLTAPYDILLTSHACRLPRAPAKPKAAAAYRAAVAAAQKQTLLLARNQIASLASQIIADPEVNLGLLRRLAVFAAPTVAAPPEKVAEIKAEQAAAKADAARASTPRPTKVEVPPAVRQLALLSLLAVFVDILPGYRIRSLSDKEQEEKVGQDVARRREYEAGLVGVYRDYLELCEAELKAAAAAASGAEDPKKARVGVGKLEQAAVRVFATLAVRAVHFNFRQNILGVVVARLSRRSWGADEEACFEAIQSVVLGDRTGEVSLEVVRLIHRMTKERRYKVNSRVLDLLLHLRLRDELGNKRASTTTATDPEVEAAKARREAEERRAAMKAREKRGKGGKAKAKEVRKGLATHLSKKQVKKQKEIRAIQDEMKEAEATVDLELRERNQTETLKLVFVLYFTVLKAPIGSVAVKVLESTMKGLSMYAHRVNVDFFRDLLNVLKLHVQTNATLLDSNNPDASAVDSDDESGSEDELDNVLLDQSMLTQVIRQIVVALKTTFDLFLNQHEASVLNLDLSEMLSHLYYVLFFLPFVAETHLIQHATLVDLALDSIHAILIRSRTAFAAHVYAGFAKRLTIIALQLPAQSAKKALGLTAHLLTKQTAAQNAVSAMALLDLDDQSRNGTYQADGKSLANSRVLDSGQTLLWELCHLATTSNADLVQQAHNVWALKDSAS